MSDSRRTFGRLEKITVYTPSVLTSATTSAVLPLIPLMSTELGASIPTAGLVSGMLIIGQLLFTLPAGWLISEYGSNLISKISLFAMCIGIGVIASFSNLVAYSLGLFLLGLGQAGYSVSRHTFITLSIPKPYQGQYLSKLGGALRAGALLGSGFATLLLLGNLSIHFLLITMIVGICFAFILEIVREKITRRPFPTSGIRSADSSSVLRAISQNKNLIIKVGLPAALISLLRNSKLLLLPLWSVGLGLEDFQILLIVTITSLLDFSFYGLSGKLMDSQGVLAAGIPSTLGLALGTISLAATQNIFWLFIIAVFLGISSGIGSGFLLTLGSKFVSETNPAPMISAFRLVSDSGGFLSPFLIASLSSFFSLSVASLVVGSLGLIGGFILMLNVSKLDKKN